MILLLFLFGLALGAPPESPSDGNKVKLQLDDHRVKLLHGNCPMFWWNFNGRCYKYVAAHLSWADAELYCVSQGANLVSIHSEEEQNFVRTLVKNFDHTEGWTWIGLSDLHKEGRWMWSDGCAVRFVHWCPHQPDNWKGIEHCGHINYSNLKKWNDYSCSTISPSVCATRTTCPKT
ncbi:lactose-binding lectin l-2 [Oreochromis niloticus]|uniref:lactose-binding lectin l-2 n=1 Tax=Oreochromis niloticus TaxID=8128 RepID=UPI000905AE9A|nr:lactose-binding lectin l-2 [Oreochromis niloticus]